MVCAIIICRSTSSRLPNKHLLKFGNKNLLEIIINQLKNIKIISNIVISTGRKNKNFHYEKYLKSKGLNIKFNYSNDENNVTKRVYECTKKINQKFTLLVSGDCPIIDKKIINQFYKSISKSNYSFVDFDKKNIVEGISIFKTLSWKKVHDLSYKDYHFEHAGSIINEKSSHFKKLFLKTPKNIQLKNTRFSIDTISDYQFFLLLFQKINTENLSYGLAIKYYKKLKHINSHVVQRGLKSNFKKKINIITHFSKKYGLGHLSRAKSIKRDLIEIITPNVKLYAFRSQKYSNIDDNGISFIKTIEKIIKDKNQILIIDLPEELIKNINLKNLYKKNTIFIDVENRQNQINTIQSLFKIKKTNFSGKKYLIINRDINFFKKTQTLNKKKIDYIFLSGGSLKFDRKFLKDFIKKKIIVILGPYVDKKYINDLNKLKIPYRVNPEDYFYLVKNAENIICKYGNVLYESLALKKKVIVDINGEKDARLKQILKLYNNGYIKIISNNKIIKKKNYKPVKDEIITGAGKLIEYIKSIY